MQWSDEAIVLKAARYGERGVRLEFFCRTHGRHGGFLRHGGKVLPYIGNRVEVTWRARLAEQLGQVRFTPKQEIFAHIADDSSALVMLQLCAALLSTALAERDPMPELYDDTVRLLQGMTHTCSIADYIRWERSLLQHCGFGLDLSRCALSGARDNLTFVSPKTGCAASREAVTGQSWAGSLLALPPFLLDEGIADVSHHDLADGLRLTGFFLDKHFSHARHYADALKILRQRLHHALEAQNAPVRAVSLAR